MTHALAVAKAPLVWSHSSVTRTRQPAWTMPVRQSRQLSLESAKAIAAKGGVVGLWSLPSDVGRSFTAYADRMTELADWLGEDHAAFGTDMNAISNPAIRSYADLQRVVSALAPRRHAGGAHPQARHRELRARAARGLRRQAGLTPHAPSASPGAHAVRPMTRMDADQQLLRAIRTS